MEEPGRLLSEASVPLVDLPFQATELQCPSAGNCKLFRCRPKPEDGISIALTVFHAKAEKRF